MNKIKTCDYNFISEYLKIQNEAINKRLSLEFKKHNWLLRKLFNQTKLTKIPVIKKKNSKSFKYKKPTKKSLRVVTVLMNFYKEQDFTTMNTQNCREVTNLNKPIHQQSYPNTGTFQRINKQNVERDPRKSTHNVANSQKRRPGYKQDGVTIFPVDDPPKAIKHNLPIVVQPERQTYMTYKPNILKNALSSNNFETGTLTSSDNLFEMPERPVPSNNDRNILTNMSTRQESIRDPKMLKNIPSKILVEGPVRQSDRPINLSNNKNWLTYEQKASTVGLDNKINIRSAFDEELLKIILTSCKENENVIMETFTSTIIEYFNITQENSEIDRYRVIKAAKIISDIFKIISDTAAKTLEEMYIDEQTQTESFNKLEYINSYPNLIIPDNIAAKQNAANKIDRNKDFNVFQQQQRNQQNYVAYQQQRLRNQNNLSVDSTNNDMTYKNQTQKSFKRNIPLGYEPQPHTSAHMQQHTLQYGIMNEQKNKTLMEKEHLLFPQNRNPNAPNVQQQRTKFNEGLNPNNLPSAINEEFDTIREHQKREYLRHHMTNETESQKRKSPYTRDDLAIFTEGPKHNYTIPVSELSKKQKYADMPNNVINMNDMLNTYGSNVDISAESIPKKIETAEFPTINVVDNEEGTSKVSHENYILDDDEDKRLTINEDSVNTLLWLSQRNKSILMRNFMSHISEMDQLKEKYGDSEENNLENELKKVVHVFQTMLEKLAKKYPTNKPRLETQPLHKCTQTENKYMNDAASPSIRLVDNIVENPVTNVPFNEKEVHNVSYAQNPREMYGYRPNYQTFQQYRNLSNQNQGHMRQHNPMPNVSNPPPFFNQLDPRLNRSQITIPMESQRSYVLTSTPTNHMLPRQAQQQQVQFGHATEHWNFEQNNRRRISNDQTQLDQIEQYEAQLMMHQQHVDQQRYYQMELQRNAWAAQCGNYPRNDWA